MKQFKKIILLIVIVIAAISLKPTKAEAAIWKPYFNKVYTDYKTVNLYVEPNGNYTKIVVYRSTKKTSGFKKIAVHYTDNDGEFLVTDKNLTFNKTYFYLIKKYYYDTTKKSDVISVKTALGSPYCEYEPDIGGYDCFYWSKVKGATGYIIYRATSPKGKYKPVKTVGKVYEYQLKRPSENKTYYYKIRAIRKKGGKTYYGAKSVAVEYTDD